jgi:hypothetical protein
LIGTTGANGTNMRSTPSLLKPLSLLGLIALFGAPACGGEDGEPTGSICPADSTLTYENFGQEFIQKYCLACHTSKESPKLTTQAAIQANIDEIDRQAAAGPNATNTNMPESGSVSTEERKKLGEWLACGAL